MNPLMKLYLSIVLIFTFAQPSEMHFLNTSSDKPVPPCSAIGSPVLLAISSNRSNASFGSPL